MAKRRMYSLDVVDSDLFTELPATARLLYYEFGVRADDDGFVGNPKKITKFAECSEEDIKILEEKDFVHLFDTGPLVIMHWRVNNQIRRDRYHETYYVEEKKKMFINHDNNIYYLDNKDGLPNVIPLVDADKNRPDEYRQEENNEEEKRKEKNNLVLLQEEENDYLDRFDNGFPF